MNEDRPSSERPSFHSAVNDAWGSRDVNLDPEVLAYRSITSRASTNVTMPNSKFWRKLAQHVFSTEELRGLHTRTRRHAPLTNEQELLVVAQLRAAAPRLARAVQHHKLLVIEYKAHLNAGGAPYLASESDSIEALWAPAWDASDDSTDPSREGARRMLDDLVSPQRFRTPVVKKLLSDPRSAAPFHEALDAAWNRDDGRQRLGSTMQASPHELRGLFNRLLGALGPAKTADKFGRVPWALDGLPSLPERVAAQRKALAESRFADSEEAQQTEPSALDDQTRADYLAVAEEVWNLVANHPDIDIAFRPRQLGLIHPEGEEWPQKPSLIPLEQREGATLPLLERSILGRVRTLLHNADFGETDAAFALHTIIAASAKPYGLPTMPSRALYLLGAHAFALTSQDLTDAPRRTFESPGLEQGGSIDYFRRRLFALNGLARYLKTGSHEHDIAQYRLAVFARDAHDGIWRRAMRASILGSDLMNLEVAWLAIHGAFETALRHSSAPGPIPDDEPRTIADAVEAPGRAAEGPGVRLTDRVQLQRWRERFADEQSVVSVEVTRALLRQERSLYAEVLEVARTNHGDRVVEDFLTRMTSPQPLSSQNETNLAAAWSGWVEEFVLSRSSGRPLDDASRAAHAKQLRRNCGSFEHVRLRLQSDSEFQAQPELPNGVRNPEGSRAQDLAAIYGPDAVLRFARAHDMDGLLAFTKNAADGHLNSIDESRWRTWSVNLARIYEDQHPSAGKASQHLDRMPSALAGVELIQRAHQSSPENPAIAPGVEK